MIMAGGTGGHVFPALAVAEELRSRGWEVNWMGTADSFESRIVPGHGFALHTIPAHRLRGQGIGGVLLAPWRLLGAMWQAGRIMRVLQPQVVLGMGGFAAAPGGLVSRLLNVPLVIHEQNSIPGLTNRLLAKLAQRVLQAFPDSFPDSVQAQTCGNPVRADIAAIPGPEQRALAASATRKVLIIGGSLGAASLNRRLPAVLSEMEVPMQIRHQAGRDKAEATSAAYAEAGIPAEVTEFIDDMAQAYAWADLVICRAGALTVSELAAVGVAAVLVPYPYAVDDHQTHNARYLVDAGAAVLVPEDLFEADLLARLKELLLQPEMLREMARCGRELALPDAVVEVADACAVEVAA